MNQVEPERFQFTSGDGLSIACVKWNGHHPVRGQSVGRLRSVSSVSLRRVMSREMMTGSSMTSPRKG